eukprot:XP_001705037.1 Hypothetical protein GL50803_39537 [Giardia lamblia ATCC 50803]
MLKVAVSKFKLLPATFIYKDVVVRASRTSDFLVIIMKAILVEAICACRVAQSVRVSVLGIHVGRVSYLARASVCTRTSYARSGISCTFKSIWQKPQCSCN